MVERMNNWYLHRTEGEGPELTGGVVIGRHWLIIAVVAIISKQGFVVVVFVPVEGFDLQAATFRMPAHYAGHSLVHVTRGACCIGSQVLDLCAHVLPALHANQLLGHNQIKMTSSLMAAFHIIRASAC